MPGGVPEWGGYLPGGVCLVPGLYLLAGVPARGVCLVLGGVPAGGCTWCPGGVPGPGGTCWGVYLAPGGYLPRGDVPGPGGVPTQVLPPCEQNDRQV